MGARELTLRVITGAAVAVVGSNLPALDRSLGLDFGASPTSASLNLAASRQATRTRASPASPPSRDGASTTDPVPRMVSALPPQLRPNLRLAYHEAHRRLATIPGCRSMFAERGADGAELLRLSLYAPPTPLELRRTCGDAQAMAFTWRRNPVVKLCPVFARTSVPRAAAALLHEALHLAGLTERPQDPDGMTTSEIDRMVAERCGVR